MLENYYYKKLIIVSPHKFKTETQFIVGEMKSPIIIEAFFNKTSQVFNINRINTDPRPVEYFALVFSIPKLD